MQHYKNKSLYHFGKKRYIIVKTTTRVNASDVKPGDLIFFQGTYDTSGASHVGIVVDPANKIMIHCGNPIQYASYVLTEETCEELTATTKRRKLTERDHSIKVRLSKAEKQLKEPTITEGKQNRIGRKGKAGMEL